MGSFLTFILVAISGFYILGFLGRLFLGVWVRKKQREFAEGKGPFSQTYTWGTGGRQSTPKSKPEGDISIQQTMPAEKKINKNVGDYVEYEEIEGKQ